jgi:hypothetical protein
MVQLLILTEMVHLFVVCLTTLLATQILACIVGLWND